MCFEPKDATLPWIAMELKDSKKTPFLVSRLSPSIIEMERPWAFVCEFAYGSGCGCILCGQDCSSSFCLPQSRSLQSVTALQNNPCLSSANCAAVHSYQCTTGTHLPQRTFSSGSEDCLHQQFNVIHTSKLAEVAQSPRWYLLTIKSCI